MTESAVQDSVPAPSREPRTLQQLQAARSRLDGVGPGRAVVLAAVLSDEEKPAWKTSEIIAIIGAAQTANAVRTNLRRLANQGVLGKHTARGGAETLWWLAPSPEAASDA